MVVVFPGKINRWACQQRIEPSLSFCTNTRTIIIFVLVKPCSLIISLHDSLYYGSRELNIIIWFLTKIHRARFSSLIYSILHVEPIHRPTFKIKPWISRFSASENGLSSSDFSGTLDPHLSYPEYYFISPL